MKYLNIITLLLIIVGGINWGLVGAAQFNLVDTLFASAPGIAKIVYILVGLAAVYQIIPLFKCCNGTGSCNV